MANIKNRLKKIEKEIELQEANYMIQKIVKNCENCKHMRQYNHTCYKNKIRVNAKYGICNYFEDGYFISDKDKEWIKECNNG